MHHSPEDQRPGCQVSSASFHSEVTLHPSSKLSLITASPQQVDDGRVGCLPPEDELQHNTKEEKEVLYPCTPHKGSTRAPPHTRGQHHLPLITPTPSSCHTPSRLKGKHNNTGCSLTSRKDPTTLHNTTSTKKGTLVPQHPPGAIDPIPKETRTELTSL